MGNPAYNSMDRLERFLRKFLPENGQNPACATRSEKVGRQGEGDAEDAVRASEEHTQELCSYCGASGAHMPIDITGFQDCICLLCKEEVIRGKDLFYQTADETIRNVKYMFSVPWDKRIQIHKCSRLEKPAAKPSGKRKKKKNSSPWMVSLEPRFVQAEMDDVQKLCIFRIRTTIPSGVVAAAAAYTTIYDSLRLAAEKNKLDQERMTGLSYWYMVHYLCCTDQERYARHYDQAVERLIPGVGAERYRELRKERGAQTSQVFFVGYDLTLERQQKEDRLLMAARENLRQEEGQTAPENHNAKRDAKSD